MPKYSSDHSPPPPLKNKNTTSTSEGTAQDSDEDRLSSNSAPNDIPIGTQIPLQVVRNDSPPLQHRESVTGLHNHRFSTSEASIYPKGGLSKHNYSSEAMLNSDYHSRYVHTNVHDHDSSSSPTICINKPEVQPVAIDVNAQKRPKFFWVKDIVDGVKAFIATSMGKRIKLAPRRRVVANVAFADALHTDKPSKVGRGMFKLYFFLFIAFMNAFSNGYDSSLMGGINNMTYYQRYFSIGGKTGSQTGLIFSAFAIGNICGSFFCGPLSDFWGRRWGMFHGAIIIIIGSCIQGFAYSGPNYDNRDMFILGRFFMGFGIAICHSAGASYVAEMSHPAWRGPMTGLYNCTYFIGGIAATWIMYRTQFIQSTLSWRLPTWIAIAPSAFLMIGCIFIPETPRWLFSNDQQEESIRVLTKYHGGGKRRSPIVILTLREMIEKILIEGSDKRWWDYSELFNSKAAWYRLTCVLGVAFIGQWAGNGTVTYFMPVLLEHVGVVDASTQLLYSAVLYVLQYVVSVCGALCTDRIGRRPVLLGGTISFIFWWLIITALMSSIPLEHAEEPGQQEASVKHGSKAAISMIYLFALTYSFTITPLQVLYPAECLAYETRAKGMGLLNLMTNVAALFNTYGISIVVERIAWRFYWVYVFWNICQSLWIYFFFVETKGRTLEEINEIFEAPNPRDKSLQQHIVEETDVGLLYRGLMNELQDMDGVMTSPGTGGAFPGIHSQQYHVPHPGTVYHRPR